MIDLKRLNKLAQDMPESAVFIERARLKRRAGIGGAPAKKRTTSRSKLAQLVRAGGLVPGSTILGLSDKMIARYDRAGQLADSEVYHPRLTTSGYVASVVQSDRLSAAQEEHRLRQARQSHPEGEFDKRGRFYSDVDVEDCDCCASIRSPSLRHPYSEMVHCRTAKHVAKLYGVDPKAMTRVGRRSVELSHA